jgi:two-component system response regulator DegU
MLKKINIAVVDDHKVIRKGLISLIDEYIGMEVVMEAENGKDLSEKLKTQAILPDIIILDLEMPVMDGIDTTTYLHRNYPDMKIIIFSRHNALEFINHLVDEGAHGFLVKGDDFEELINAIHDVLNSGYYFNDKVKPEMIGRLMEKNKIKPEFTKVELLERDIELLQLVYNEKTTKEIADKLHIEPHSVTNYKTRIIEKTNSRNIIGALMYAVKHGLIK